MQIRVTEAEIRTGLAMYLISRGFLDVTPENLKCTFVQGRKPKGGLSAEIEELSTPSALPATQQAPAEKPKEVFTPQGEIAGVTVVDAATGSVELSGSAAVVKEEAEQPAPTPVAEEVVVAEEAVAKEQAETAEKTVAAEEPATVETTAALFG